MFLKYSPIVAIIFISVAYYCLLSHTPTIEKNEPIIEKKDLEEEFKATWAEAGKLSTEWYKAQCKIYLLRTALEKAETPEQALQISKDLFDSENEEDRLWKAYQVAKKKNAKLLELIRTKSND